jgi:nucleolar protein 12
LAATPDVKMSKALQVKAGKTDKSKGSVNAYVVFSAMEHAEAALALNMTTFSGHHIRVDRAAPPKDADNAGAVHYDSRRSVFVGNLPRDVEVRSQTPPLRLCGSREVA